MESPTTPTITDRDELDLQIAVERVVCFAACGRCCASGFGRIRALAELRVVDTAGSTPTSTRWT